MTMNAFLLLLRAMIAGYAGMMIVAFLMIKVWMIPGHQLTGWQAFLLYVIPTAVGFICVFYSKHL